jgi:hypothetical protein
VVRSLRERSPRSGDILPRRSELVAHFVRDPLAGRADHVLTLDLWVTQTGTARADEVLRLLGLADLLDAGAVLERTTVEIRDEVADADAADGPPDGPAEALPLDPAAVAAGARDDEPNQPAAAGWGASPNGPVVE